MLAQSFDWDEKALKEERMALLYYALNYQEVIISHQFNNNMSPNLISSKKAAPFKWSTKGTEVQKHDVLFY